MGFGKGFLDITSKAQARKEIIDKFIRQSIKPS